MGLGIAEVNQQSVADVAGQVALKAADRFRAGLLIGEHHLAQAFGVGPFGERGRAHQVTEHHGELASFGYVLPRLSPFWDSGPRTLGSEPLPSLDVGRGTVDFTGERSGTGATELEPGRVLKPALRTRGLQRGGALAAKFHSLGIIKATARTMHTRYLLIEFVQKNGA